MTGPEPLDSASFDPRDLLEEYVDGLLSDDDRARVAAALAADSALRAEFESVKRFSGLVAELPADPSEEAAVNRIMSLAREDARRRGRLLRIVAGVAAAAALVMLGVWLGRREVEPLPRNELADVVADNAREFGRRLGTITRTRREGRVPRLGTGDLEVPPAAAMGIVFEEALGVLGARPPIDKRSLVRTVVREHYQHTIRLAPDLAGESRRAEASLHLFRRLQEIAGIEVADAWYDVFRPGLAHLETVRRLRAGTMAMVLRETAPEHAEEYVQRYERALARLQGRYGQPRLAAVLQQLAPRDRREVWTDAADEGVPRDTVLAIRASMYQAAVAAGVDRLYIDF